MPLSLRIENETSLPDGGPLSVTVTGKRGIDIGRDQHLDWTLPDPTRFISSKHCEVRYTEGAYWLYDVSTNGTMLYGVEGRLKGPHRLRDGDRLVIGNYIIAVSLDGDEVAAPSRIAEPVSYQDLWNSTGDVAPPVDPKEIRAPSERPAPVRPDFLDWAVDVPNTFTEEPPRPPARLPPAAPRNPVPLPDEELDWASGPRKEAPPPPPPPSMPTPRRPMWVSNEPDGPWGAPRQAGAPAPADESFDPPAEPLPSFPQVASPAVFEPGPEEPLSPAEPAPAPAVGGGQAGMAAALARGARLDPLLFEGRDTDRMAEELGALMLIVVENMRQLLAARLQAKRLARSASQTVIQAVDNNPLKFAPSAEEALRLMFGKRTRGYLDARQSLEQGFQDVKTHQVRTYSAMQQALTMLIDDLDPRSIDQATEADRGIAALVVSRKARLWDAYVARWQAKARRGEGGMLDAFMQYFAECYDRDSSQAR